MEPSPTRDLTRKLSTVALVAAAVWLFCAAAATAQTYRIVDIRVAGNKNVSISTITTVAALTIGSELTGTSVQDAVRNLYAKGMFRDIAIDVDPAQAGVVVTIRVAEYPQLSSVSFKGNKKISSKDVLEKLKLAPGGYISDALKLQSKHKIESEYMAKGYFLAQATPVVEFANDSTKAELIFSIKEFDKVKVETVVLTGVERLKPGDLIKKMSNRKRGFLRSSDFKREKYPEDKDKIIEFCNNKGHIDAYIKSDSFAIDTARNRMTIFIDMYEGPRYYFGSSGFSGNELLSGETLAKTLKYQPAEVFDQEKYQESIGELYSAYQEEGYLHTRVADERTTRDSTIDIEYRITEGLPSQIKLVDIVGNTKTKEKVIRREMMVRPGQTFRRSVLMRSLRDVMQLNFFSNVEPDIRDLPSGDIDLIIKTEEKATGQVNAGAGYSGQDKLVGTFGLGIPNFRGNGQDVSINVDFGSRRNSVTLGFTEPWFLGTPTLVGGEIFNLNRRWYEDFTEGRYGGSVRLGRRLKWPDNYFRAYVSYRLEAIRYYDLSTTYRNDNGYYVTNSNGTQSYIPFATSLARFNEEWMKTSAFSFTIERDSRDLPTFATNGARVSYTGEVSGGLLGGRWKYYKHSAQAQRFFPLFGGTALIGKAKVGYISAKSYDDILPSELFTPGGTDPDGTVRGYPDASLSPRRFNTSIGGTTGAYDYAYGSILGRMLGGMAEAIYNVTFQVPVMKNQLYLLSFADAGTSWEGKKNITPFSGLYKGAGFGFRLVVPAVGVIGFDFGYAFDTLPGESRGWKTHFQIGPGE